MTPRVLICWFHFAYFAVFPRALISPPDLPQQQKRMRAIQAACTEMTKTFSQRRIAIALRANLPAATDENINIKSEVHVYQESPINKCVGPYRVTEVMIKHVFLLVKNYLVKGSLDKFKLYMGDNAPPDKEAEPILATGRQITPESNEATSNALDDLMAAHRLDVDALRTDFEDPIQEWEMPGPDFYVHMTKLLLVDDPEHNSDRFRDAKFKEVTGLEQRKT